ncbi:hypothetical protein Mp_7g16100 [Marchantia polymorpha subsp. ruderalis]|uniref:Uncharacterized protein n=2 Tax=Marchantia polymorpha TaxID=3197 RepID=A0AAF6C071_MARPO|nr:hypothetical protein MARPO_0111s0010 [Marchantia polymorpha]BBN17655.1 hypothetical protein Mp_7g16100 [Marchantia polymorpha subsp. ruderalis]|eukprot:PTQ31449.1 hypothetical protein MARPO_0111s0010 [Marchantia polymorpha]
MTSAVAANQSGDALYRGVSEGTGLAAANLARTSTADESAEQMQSCECCGLKEECTRAYIGHVRTLFCGRYVCGLCAEAVKEERGRLQSASMEDALRAHMVVCAQFNHAARADPLVQLAAVAELMRQILRKSGSNPGSPSGSPKRQWRSNVAPLRSQSCIVLKAPSAEFS